MRDLDFSLDEFVLQKAEEDEAVKDALDEFRESVAVERAVGGLEKFGKVFAVAFEVVKKIEPDLFVGSAEETELPSGLIRAREFGDIGVESARLAGGTGREGFAREEVIELGKLVGIEPVPVVEVAMAAGERRIDVGFRAAVEDMELLEISEDRQRRAGTVAVTDGLKGSVGVGFELDGRLLGFAEKARVAEIWGGVKGVVGAA